ncbi:hypothetical protein J4Q44_G00299210 [Coregonus suidteri]|uniref:Uncharacterized protein n=1 Tax=Coregonus suidteri TaxID=861788 RepID=A0AAN8KXE0_9TELE
MVMLDRREEELGLLEALKLLMLGRAVELHTTMQEGGDVPVFCWRCLRTRPPPTAHATFLSNHLSQVGFSGGLEQVEMFLLGICLAVHHPGLQDVHGTHRGVCHLFFPTTIRKTGPVYVWSQRMTATTTSQWANPMELQVPEDLTAS